MQNCQAPEIFKASAFLPALLYLATVLLDVPIALPTSAAHAAGPSFNCSRANSDVEKLICRDATLSSLDLTLNKFYKEIPFDIRADQAVWIEERDNCNNSIDCLSAIYKSRIEDVKALATLGEPSADSSHEAVELLRAALACPGRISEDHFEKSVTKRNYAGDGVEFASIDSTVSDWIGGSATGDYHMGERSTFRDITKAKFADLLYPMSTYEYVRDAGYTVSLRISCKQRAACVEVQHSGTDVNGVETQRSIYFETTGCDKASQDDVRDAIDILIKTSRR